MPGLTSEYTFLQPTSPHALRRMKHARAYRHLTSRLMVSCFLLSFIVAAIIAPTNASGLLVGVFLITSALAATFLLLLAYGFTFFPYRWLPKNPPYLLSATSEQGRDIAEVADFELLYIFAKARTVEEIWRTLVKTKTARVMLTRLMIDSQEYSQRVSSNLLPTLLTSDVVFNAINIASHTSASSVGIPHLLGVFLLHPTMQPYLREQHLTPNDINFMIWWQWSEQVAKREHRRWWRKEALVSAPGLGLSWAAGFTPLIDQFAYIPAGNAWDTAFGRHEEVSELIASLAREQQSNVLLVGQAGVGQLGIIKEVAQRIAMQQAHPALRRQRVVYMHLGQLMSQAGSPAAQLSFIARALNEMEKAGNIIAVIDGLAALLGNNAEGSANVGEILSPFFSSQKVRVVVMMSSDEYHLRFKNNSELLHLFEVVQVEPLLPAVAQELLALTVPAWERKTHLTIPYQTIREIIQATSDIWPDIAFPEKAFDMLDEASVRAQGAKQKTILPIDIQTIISQKIGIPVKQVSEAEKDKLAHLEDFIHRRVVNQSSAVAAVSRALIRARAGVTSTSRPIGTFLFLGPTGVGKTETAKALTEAYFDSPELMQRLDMSEFQTVDAVSQLLGDTSHPVGRLTSLIADHPFCVLLLDEFEKAHLSVQQLFLQVFDEGRLSDARGRQYSFRHALIIVTSNAGAEFIRQHVAQNGQVAQNFEDDLRNHILQQGIFRPELLNRFDGVITFTPLSPEHIKEVATLMMRKLNQRLDAEHGVTVSITEELINYLVTIGYNPEFGARPMARAIQNSVEYAVAQQVLKNQITPGQVITLNPEALKAVSG